MPAFPLRAVLLSMSIFVLILGTMSWRDSRSRGTISLAAAATAFSSVSSNPQPPSAPSASHPSLLPPPPSSSPPLSHPHRLHLKAVPNGCSRTTVSNGWEVLAQRLSVWGDWNNWSTTAGSLPWRATMTAFLRPIYSAREMPAQEPHHGGFAAAGTSSTSISVHAGGGNTIRGSRWTRISRWVNNFMQVRKRP